MELRDYRRLSLETGLSVNYILKDKEISKIFLILQDKIPNIILKGGTGINRVYLDETKRFSEDIIFDVFSKKSINDLKLDLFEILKKELSNYIVNKPRLMNKTIRFDIQYINELNNKDKIMLEFRLQKDSFPNIEKKIINFGFVPFKSSLYFIYSKEELIFQKLIAFCNRDSSKDIYDLYYLFNLDFNKKELNKLISIYNKSNNLDVIKESKLKSNLILKSNSLIKQYTNNTNHFISNSKRNHFDLLVRNLISKLDLI
jgi:predicted nucleotidyltransferase component of viral defense system